MKNYQKPTINLEVVLISTPVANLSDWLEGTGNEYRDAGITTYEIAS